MRQVNAIRVDGIDWMQHPGNYLSSREDILVSYFLANPAYKCVSWSEDNLIAFCGPEGIYKMKKSNKEGAEKPLETPPLPNGKKSDSNTPLQDKSDDMDDQEDVQVKKKSMESSCLQYVIFLVNPAFPTDQLTLKTPHQSRIKHLVFSPVAFGPLLLSADEGGRVCLWEMKDNYINQWSLSHSFSIPYIISFFWLPLCLYSLPNDTKDTSYPDITQKFKEKGSAPPRQRIPAFLAITRNGSVLLIYKEAFQGRWNMISTRLPAGSQLSQCDLVFLPELDGAPSNIKAYLAVAGASLPNRVAIYNLSFGFPAPCVKERCPKIKSQLCSLITLQAKGVPRYSVTHVAFDISVALHDKNLRPIVVVTSNGKQCFVEKWKAEGPSTYKKIEEFGSNLQDRISHHSYISVLRYFSNGDILLGYFDGLIELRNGQTLQLLKSCHQGDPAHSQSFKRPKTECKSEPTDDHRMMLDEEDGKEQITGQPFPSPLCLAVSPNNSLFCLLDYQSILYIYVRSRPFDLNTETSKNTNPSLKERWMCDALELSMILGTSYWDILLFIRDSCKNPDKYLFSVMRWLVKDFEELSGGAKSAFYFRFQSLFSQLLRISESQEINHMDCQARLFVNHVHDTFHSCFRQVPPQTTPEQMWHQGTFDKDPVLTESARALFSLTEWVIYFAVFFARNIFRYLQTEDVIDLSMTNQRYLHTFFICNASEFSSLHPCFALLFDDTFMNQLILIITASRQIRSQAASRDEKVVKKIVQHEIIHNEEMAVSLVSIFRTAKNAIQTVHKRLLNTFPHDIIISNTIDNIEAGTGFTMAYFNLAKKALKGVLLDKSSLLVLVRLEKFNLMNQLFQDLDLGVSLIGFIDQNQIKVSRKREFEYPEGSTEFGYKYKNIEACNKKRFDVVTRNEINADVLTNAELVQCVQCNRFSIKFKEKNDASSLFLRWKFCCPLCGGKWKLVPKKPTTK